MDPALLREREAFRKKAISLPTVEKRQKKSTPDDRPKKRPKTSSQPSKGPSDGGLNYKTMSGSSQFKFGVLSKIVRFMKLRHQQGDSHPLSIDEILDETNQLDVGQRMKHWLATEALMNNPKIEVIENDHFKYKPKYNIVNRKGLLRLLEKHDLKGLGGILLEDVEEAVPNCAKALKQLGDRILYVTRPIDKKKILFYNDSSYQYSIDEEFVKLWRGVAVDGVDEAKIDEYLERQGITTMQDVGGKRVMPIQKRKKNSKKHMKFKKQNTHLDGILEDYNPDLQGKAPPPKT